jgi:hypothetical protein
MNLSEELKTRGFINQISGEDLSLIFDTEKRVVYQGILLTLVILLFGCF